MPASAGASGLSVAAGAVVGVLARMGLDALLPHAVTELPLSTMIVNAMGSLLLGLLVSGPWTRRVPAWLSAGLGTGMLGTFTTLSAISVSTVALFAAGRAGEAVLTLLGSIVTGFAAAWLGVLLGEAWTTRRSGAAPGRGRG